MDATLTKALQIAGWPEWESGNGRNALQPFEGGWRVAFLSRGKSDPSGAFVSEHVAHAILEKHLREWLEARGWHLRPIIGSTRELIGYAVVRNSEEWMAVDGPYLAALAAAVVECGEGKA